MKFEIGLTDELDNERIFINDEVEHLSYNVITPPEWADNPEAKATLVWDMADLPAVKNAYKAFQSLQDKPHLKIFDVRQQPYKLDPSIINTELGIEFASMLPATFAEKEVAVYEKEDYEALQQMTEFGDLVFDFELQLQTQGRTWPESLSSAYSRKSLDMLAEGVIDILAIPAFNCRFEISKAMAQVDVRQGRTPLSQLWLERNEQELTDKGYDINDYRTNWGWLVAGKLETDHSEAYEAIQKYMYVTHYRFIE